MLPIPVEKVEIPSIPSHGSGFTTTIPQVHEVSATHTMCLQKLHRDHRCSDVMDCYDMILTYYSVLPTSNTIKNQWYQSMNIKDINISSINDTSSWWCNTFFIRWISPWVPPCQASFWAGTQRVTWRDPGIGCEMRVIGPGHGMAWENPG